MNLVEILKSAAESEKGIRFIEAGKESFTSYAELLGEAEKVLGGMQERGYQPGDRVILQIADPHRFLIAFWGCLLGGMLPAALPVALDEEKERKLRSVSAVLKTAHLLSEERLLSLRRERVLPGAMGEEREIQSVETLLLFGGRGREVSLSEKDAAMIQFSSGSTGRPKGVLLSHRNILSNLLGISRGADFSERDHVLSWLPLSHDMGLIGAHLSPILIKANQCLMLTQDFIRKPGLWLDKLTEHAITVTLAPNFAYKLILGLLSSGERGDWDLSSLRYLLNGAEPISADLCEAFLRELSPFGLSDKVFINAYGMAEASLLISLSEAGSGLHFESFSKESLTLFGKVRLSGRKEEGRKLVDLGRAAEGCEIRICGERDLVLPEGSVGEIEIRGENVSSGYFGEEELTEQLFSPDGWLRTGDAGFFYGGRLYISGRLKEILFVNGQNFYPSDIEEALEKRLRFPAENLAVSAIPDQDNIDRLYLFVSGVGEEELSSFSKRAREAALLTSGLRIFGIVPVERMPKTESGKRKRTELVRLLREGELAIYEAERDLSGKEDPEEDLTKTEKTLMRLFGEFMEESGGGSWSRFDNFMELGLDSVKLARLSARIREEFGRELRPSDLFRCPNVHALSRFLDSREALRLPSLHFKREREEEREIFRNGFFRFEAECSGEGREEELFQSFVGALRSLSPEEGGSFHVMMDEADILCLCSLKGERLGEMNTGELFRTPSSPGGGLRFLFYDTELNRSNLSLSRNYDLCAEYRLSEGRAACFLSSSSAIGREELRSFAVRMSELLCRKREEEEK